jgi:hypothetical protein
MVRSVIEILEWRWWRLPVALHDKKTAFWFRGLDSDGSAFEWVEELQSVEDFPPYQRRGAAGTLLGDVGIAPEAVVAVVESTVIAKG